VNNVIKFPKAAEIEDDAKCNKCGKTLGKWDMEEGHIINHQCLPAGTTKSKYGGFNIKVRMCSKCKDGFFKRMEKEFVINPIVDNVKY